MLSQQGVAKAKKQIIDDLQISDSDEKHIAIGVTPPSPAGVPGFRLALRVRDEAAAAVVRQKASDLGLADGDVDLAIIGTVRPLDATTPAGAPAAKLHIGMSIGHVNGSPGTLGFFANRDGKFGFVSCNHVIGLADTAALGDEIFAPAVQDQGTLAGHLAKIASFTSHHFKYADAAFAEAEESRRPDKPGFISEKEGSLVAELAQIRDGMTVKKLGRSTGVSTGSVTLSSIDYLPMSFAGGPTFRLHHVIEIVGTDKDSSGNVITFGDPGDSGSLVWAPGDDGVNRPLGLLFGKADSGNAYANPIGKVMYALGLKLVV
jgi:hypothetical protein